MRFLVDECTGPAVATWLRGAGHDAFSVFDSARGASDEWILARAVEEQRVLITNDKDFGDRVFRDGEAHAGVVLLRLDDDRAANKIDAIRRLLAEYGDVLQDRFVVVAETSVRIRPPAKS